MRERRFHVENLTQAPVQLTGSERRHAVDVLRVSPGDSVTLFDGQGAEARARVAAITKDAVEFELTETPRAPQGRTPAITLAVACPKGSRADWLVEKCAELGVARLVFIETQRTEVHPGEGKIERWRRKAIEAAKQSGGAQLIELDAGRTLQSVIEQRDESKKGLYGSTSSDGMSLAGLLAAQSTNSTKLDGCLCVIGPEGGLTDEEQAQLKAGGFHPITLSPRTLRVETAAIAVAAIWAAHHCGR